MVAIGRISFNGKLLFFTKYSAHFLVSSYRGEVDEPTYTGQPYVNFMQVLSNFAILTDKNVIKPFFLISLLQDVTQRH